VTFVRWLETVWPAVAVVVLAATFGAIRWLLAPRSGAVVTLHEPPPEAPPAPAAPPIVQSAPPSSAYNAERRDDAERGGEFGLIDRLVSSDIGTRHVQNATGIFAHQVLAPAPPPLTDATLSAEAPAEMRIGDVGPVRVRVALPGFAALAVAVPTQISLDPADKIVAILTIDGACVRARGSTLLQLSPPSPDRPSDDAFEIEAVAPGDARVAILFRQRGSELGMITLAVRSIVGSTGQRTTTASTSALPRDERDDAELLLLVDEVTTAGGVAYRYRLVSEALGFDYMPFDSPPVLDSGGGATLTPRQWVESIYKRVAGALVGSGADGGARALRATGTHMSGQLFTREFAELLWDSRDRINTVHVKSWEPFIPWELVRLTDPRTNDVDDRFLAEYALVRSLYGATRPRRLGARDWRFMRARYPEGSERPVFAGTDYFSGLLPLHDVTPVEIQPRVGDLLDAVAAGDFDVLHVGCHGEAEHDDIDRSTLIIGDRAEGGGRVVQVSVDSVTVAGEAKLSARHPIVFLNACSSGRLAPSLTAWGGWPLVFWKAGAGVFVGTSWPVRDGTASLFSAAFYEALWGNATLAEAARAARAAVKNPEDPSWLAFKVYGYPGARFAASAAAAGPSLGVTAQRETPAAS
jgi:hypothetical protein